MVSSTKLCGPSLSADAQSLMITGENLPENVVESLADLQEAYPTADAPTRLDEKIPKGADIFHELTHLTTNYVGDQWCK